MGVWSVETWNLVHQLLACCGVSRAKIWFVVFAVDCGMGEVGFVVDDGNFDSYQHLSC